MTEIAGSPPVEKKKESSNSTFLRVARFMALRIITLFITVVIGIYLTIMIANMGGYMDNIMRSEIRERTTASVLARTANSQLSTEAKREMIEREIELANKRYSLDVPLAVRNMRYLGNAITLDLGRAQFMLSDHGSRMVKNIILERLPATLLLMGTSQFLLFFVSLFLALRLSRSYGSFWDRLVITLSPSSTIPAWFYGIFLILIFAAMLKLLPFGGMVDAPVPTNKWDYAMSVLKHLILPASSLILSGLFLSIYNWRTFFLIYSSEDYVDMAKAKGLSDKDIERSYILRPTLPTIITSFALLLIGVWTGATITETVFLWPGLGRTLYQAIGYSDTPVILGSTIIYAYLLALTVFLLDFVYAIVDPRVKVGGN
ncbi:MAG TPA: ABC transporter permease [Bellilinea sp.]|nr:ABC transporter permease [Bellilinea sp.]